LESSDQIETVGGIGSFPASEQMTAMRGRMSGLPFCVNAQTCRNKLFARRDKDATRNLLCVGRCRLRCMSYILGTSVEGRGKLVVGGDRTRLLVDCRGAE
jgi:hypothetical protein